MKLRSFFSTCVVGIITVSVFTCPSTLWTQSEKTITMHFKTMPLREAILSLAKQSQVEIIFGDVLVANKTVNCEATNLALEEALSLLLSNTSLTFQKLPNNQIVLVQQKRQKTNIVGRVFDAKGGMPLPNTNIQIVGTEIGAAANDSGWFLIINSAVEICTLKITHVGYLTVRKVVKPDTLKSPLSIQLEPVTLSTQRVTVEGQSNKFFNFSDQPGQISASPYHLALLPAIDGQNPISALQYLPGINSDNDGASGLSFRGGLPSQNLILFDGITLLSGTHGFGLPQDAIQDIRIYKSAYPAKYFGRLSGIVDITASTANFNKFKVRAGLNPLSGSLTFEIPMLNKSSSLLVSARRSYTDYVLAKRYKKNAIPELGFSADETPDMDFYDLVSKMTVTPGPNDVFSFTLLSSKYSQLHKDKKLEVELKNSTLGFSSKWLHQWHQKFNSQALFAYSEFSTQRSARKKFDVRFENSWILNPSHKTEFGLNIIRNILGGQSIKEEVLDLASLYLQETWRVTTQLTATLGLRSVTNITHKKQYLEPTVSTKWKANQHWTFKGAWSLLHQFVENTNIGEERAKNPPKSEHQILGINYKKDWLEFDIEVYRKSLENIVSEYIYSDERAGSSKGFDLVIKQQKGNFTNWISYNFNDNQNLTGPALRGSVNYVFQSKHNIKAVTNFSKSGWNVSASWRFSTSHPYIIPESKTLFWDDGTSYSAWEVASDGQVDRLAARHSLDLSVNKTLNETLFKGQIGLSLYNTYDHNNPLTKGFFVIDRQSFVKTTPLLGFTPTINLQIQFR